MQIIRKKKINYKKYLFLPMLLLLSFGIVKIYTRAADLSKFDPGNIMSDYVMSNYTSMTEAQIHSFLQSKNDCNNTKTYMASWYPKLSYHIENGTFVCLWKENFNGESAAHIIWQAAQDYKINPQFLITLLEKEQGLITDTWPNNIQYRSATGFGCPDTAACDTTYYGFKNQVRQAANLFRNVLNGGWSNYPVGQQFVQYNPNASCGGTVVNIQNRATSALYRYTPYQPNQAALNAGYGTGDGCSAYGNRNLYALFTDWFGSTQIASPRILSNPVTTATVGLRYEYNVEYDNTTGLPVQYKIIYGPNWLSFNGNVLNGMPHLDEGDVVKVKFEINNNGFISDQEFNINVAQSKTPVTSTNAKIDFNKDGFSDIAVTSKYPDNKSFNLWIYPGTKDGFGTPIFQQYFAAEKGWDINKTKLFAGDSNGDGFADLTMLSEKQDGGIRVSQIRGNSQYLKSDLLELKDYGLEYYNGWYWKYADTIQSPADFNKDGYDDIAVTSAFADGKTFNLWIYPGTKDGFGKPIFQQTFPAMSGWNQGKVKFFAGDSNGDGFGDLTMMIEKEDGGIKVRQIRGGQEYLTSQYIELNDYTLDAKVGWLWRYIDSIQSPADFNKDGFSDIAATSAFADGKTFNLWIFPGGANGFEKPIFQKTFMASDGWNQAKTKFFAGGADGDGFGDLTMLIERTDGGADIKQIRGSYSMLQKDPIVLTNYALYPWNGWYWKYANPVR